MHMPAEAPTDGMIVWQRFPQGWIELRAFDGDDDASTWWDRYLASGEDWLPDEARIALTDVFVRGREVFRDTPFDFAGMIAAGTETPSVFTICTKVLPAGDAASAGAATLLRVGEVVHAETFVALDQRRGSLTVSRVKIEGSAPVALSIGHLPLPAAESGHVLVIGVSTAVDQVMELALYTAIALDSTHRLPAGVTPDTVTSSLKTAS
jgi:hypothetical protein